MSIIEAIILGIIQGATEFLPVSSSGHSILLPAIFGMSEPGINEVIIAHQGTLLAVLLYFWRDIWAIIKGVFQGLVERNPMGNAQSRLGWFLVIGSVPAAVIGLLFEDTFETIFANPMWAALFLLATAGFLVLGERMLSGEKKLDKMSWADAMIIGCFQVFALFPGVSRSGSTIVGGLTRGLDRELAARYSFLMSIPVILGAGLLKLADLIGATGINYGTLAVTFIVSFFVGLACIHFLIQWVKERSLYPFAIYCALFGVFSLIYFGLF